MLALLQEMEDAHHEVRQKRRRLPVGTSDYQAAWLLDAEDYGAEGDSDEEHAADDLRPSQPPSTAAPSAADDLYMDDGTATEAGDLMVRSLRRMCPGVICCQMAAAAWVALAPAAITQHFAWVT